MQEPQQEEPNSISIFSLNFKFNFTSNFNFQLQFSITIFWNCSEGRLGATGVQEADSISYWNLIAIFNFNFKFQFSESAAKVDLVQLGCRSCSRSGGGRPEPSAQGYEFALKLSQFAHDDDDGEVWRFSTSSSTSSLGIVYGCTKAQSPQSCRWKICSPVQVFPFLHLLMQILCLNEREHEPILWEKTSALVSCLT